MIASDIITRVRRKFGDEAAVQVQDADIIRYINDAQLEIVKHNDGALQATGFINIVANQQEYTLPTDLFILKTVRYKFSDMLSYAKLDYRSMQQFDESIDGWDGTAFTATNPSIYTEYNGNIIVFPIPDRSATNGFKLLYNKRPTDVVLSSDPLSVPLIYHNTVEKYCMLQASLMDEDLEPVQLYQGMFTDDMTLLRSRESQSANERYQSITVVELDE